MKAIVIITSCYVAFAIGSNNVANASGPIMSMISNELNLGVGEGEFLHVMVLATLIIAPCFAIGSSIFGHRIVHTTGKEIIEFGPLGAILISVITASLMLFASTTRGIPTSLVQMNTAAIIGLGIYKVGWKEILNRTSIKRLVTVWIIAPVIALCLSFIFTAVADKLSLL